MVVDGASANEQAKIDAATNQEASFHIDPPPSRFIRAYAEKAPIARVEANSGQNTCPATDCTAWSIAALLSEYSDRLSIHCMHVIAPRAVAAIKYSSPFSIPLRVVHMLSSMCRPP